MPIELDKKDRRLLSALAHESRTSHAQLAKQAGLRKSTLSYRIARLRSQGVIRRFTAVVDLTALGYHTAAVLVRCPDEAAVAALRAQLTAHPFVDWLIALSGDWDFLAEFAYADLPQLSGHLAALRSAGAELSVLFSESIIKVEHLIPELAPEPAPPTRSRAPTPLAALDDTDRAILSALAEDASLPTLAIADRIGASADTVRSRMQQLRQRRVLLKCLPEISLPAIGYAKYLHLLHLRSPTPRSLSQLSAALAANKNITYAFTDPITSAALFVSAFRDPQGIDRLVRSLRADHSQLISSHTFLLIRDELALSPFPAGLAAPLKTARR